MATVIICDGCEQPAKEVKRVGYVKKRDYCPECAAKAERFESDLDQLHTRLADEWAIKYEALQKAYSQQLMALPDDLEI